MLAAGRKHTDTERHTLVSSQARGDKPDGSQALLTEGFSSPLLESVGLVQLPKPCEWCR